jgi:hypothetical protein
MSSDEGQRKDIYSRWTCWKAQIKGFNDPKFIFRVLTSVLSLISVRIGARAKISMMEILVKCGLVGH